MLWDRTNRPLWLRLAVGALAAVLAALLRLEFLDILEFRATFITFYPAVAVAALYGGFEGGMLATLVSAALADYFWIEPVGHFSVADFADLMGLVIFIGSGALISFLAEAAYRAQARAHEAEERARLATERRLAEEDVRRQREWLRVTLMSIGDAVIATDASGRVAFVNPVAEALTGWRMEEAVGIPVREVFRIVNEKSHEPVADVIDCVLREGCAVALANHAALVSREGREIPIEDSAAPIRDDAGKVFGAVLVFHDVTERRRARETLLGSEARLRLAVESAEMGTWDFDPVTGALAWSDRCKAILGLLPEVPLDYQAFLDLLHPGDRARVGESVQAALDPTGEGRFRAEFRAVGREGAECWISAAGRALFDEEGGERRAVRFIGTVLDVTESKRTEMERETTAEFLRLVNETGDTRGLVRASAAFFQRQSGCEAVGIRLVKGDDYPYHEARGFSGEFIKSENSLCTRDGAGNILRDSVGIPLLECMCGNIIGGRFDPSKPFFTSGGSFWTNSTTRLLATTSEADRQARTRNRCNGEGYESVALIPLRLGTKAFGLLQLNDRRGGRFSTGVITLWERLGGYLAIALARSLMEEEVRNSRDDLELRVRERTAELAEANEILRTEAKERERAENRLQHALKRLGESNQALQDFASVASHDLQEPLRKVSGFGAMLQQRCGDSLGPQGKDYLERMLGANRRMQSLLTSLLEYSRLSTRADPFVEVELSGTVREVLSDLEVRIAKSGGEVRVGELPVIEAEPTQMRQLFQNLLGNGLKFHKEGEKPLVEVSCEAVDHQTVRIAVEDNGIGFEEQHLDKIFAPFQRLHGRSSSYEGTGMGLAICKKIVERHGGTITATSVPGKGSTFIVTLPQRHAPAP
jgi:PAS domain S-box-containing protein